MSAADRPRADGGSHAGGRATGRRRLVVLWIAAQIVFLAGWWTAESRRSTSGTAVLVRTLPVDPRDLLRGQYLALRYDFSRPDPSWLPEDLPPAGTDVWVRLTPKGEFHEPTELSLEPLRRLAPGEVAMRGEATETGFRFGVERYFVPEGAETPDPARVTVRLLVGKDARPRIETVYVDGSPWP